MMGAWDSSEKAVPSYRCQRRTGLRYHRASSFCGEKKNHRGWLPESILAFGDHLHYFVLEVLQNAVVGTPFLRAVSSLSSSAFAPAESCALRKAFPLPAVHSVTRGRHHFLICSSGCITCDRPLQRLFRLEGVKKVATLRDAQVKFCSIRTSKIGGCGASRER